MFSNVFQSYFQVFWKSLSLTLGLLSFFHPIIYQSVENNIIAFAAT